MSFAGNLIYRFLLPFVQYYDLSGEFNWKRRLQGSIVTHLRNFIIISIIGLLFFILLIVKNLISLANLQATLTALSNGWGLFLIIVFLGHGLVEVPRHLWRLADYFKNLQYNYIKATHIDEEVALATSSLDDSVKAICVARGKLVMGSMLESQMDLIMGLCPSGLREYHMSKSLNSGKSAGPIVEGTLVTLHQNLKAALAEYKRTKIEWSNIIRLCVYLEDLVIAQTSPLRRIVFSFTENEKSCCPRNKEFFAWFWMIRLRPLVLKVLSILAWMLSILIILGECTLFINLPIGLFPMLIDMKVGYISSQAICLLPLSYILLCTYYGLFKLKLPGLYGLYEKNTETCSLVYCAYYLARLSAPLAFNFFLFAKVPNAVFFDVMGRVDKTVDIWTTFMEYFPLLLAFFSLLNYANVYGRVLSVIGINQLSYFDDEMGRKAQEGQGMVKREKTAMIKDSSRKNLSDWEMINLDIMKDSGHLLPGKSSYERDSEYFWNTKP